MQLVLVDTGDLKRASKALRNHADGKRLRKEAIAEFKAALGPSLPRVKAAWLAAPSQGHGTASRGRRDQPDIRKLLADSTWIQARLTGKEAGVRIRSDGRKMPDGIKALGGYAEGIRRRPWRHPVHGNRNVWVTQQPFPGKPFYTAAAVDELRARRACNDAVDRVFDQIERA
jgi:hypothetical protein